MSEAFVYMWHDSKNSMYYIGSHEGTPDDGYTHSSQIMEQFKADNIPEGFSRRILAYGTEPDMRQLENDLLNNRKEKCWDKYYNATISFPPPPKYGQDNHSYIDGRWGTPEYKLKYYREYREKHREKIQEQQREYYEKHREKLKKKAREYHKEYYKENREKVLERKRGYKEYHKEYREKNREKIREYQREYYTRKKAEKMGTSTLDIN